MATTSTSTSTTLTGAVAAAPVVKHGPKDKKWIALTFDDNYQGANATKTIAVLKKYDVPATFFVIGHYIDTGPELAQEIADAGFEVGDHTRSHANCPKLSKRALRIEIGNGTDHYHQLTGAPTVPLFRPPGGFIDRKTSEVAAEKGFRFVVMWDIDTNDWRGHTASQITESVIYNAHNGAIVLMHMAAKHTAEALPGIITRLRTAGYELVPLTKMLGL
ncbi:MAG: polysaccharide deacetylase family protein [Actinobacteria bacterium]|nr:polysaccharide deacetylase family protein [Actinomycetota bacterium]